MRIKDQRTREESRVLWFVQIEIKGVGKVAAREKLGMRKFETTYLAK